MWNICVRDAPCWDLNVLNASCTKLLLRTCFCVECKTATDSVRARLD